MAELARIIKHRAVLHKASIQLSNDHITFVSGDLDPDLRLEVPHEVLYIPLATWMGMSKPEIITNQVQPGDLLHKETPDPDPLQILANFNAFSHRCADAEYTDTGEAWYHLNALAGALSEAIE